MTVRRREIKDREEWLSWRKKNINASEAGALLGVDKFRTPLQVYYEKFGDLVTEETEAMRRGRWLEPAVIKAVSETRPDWEVIPRMEYYDDPELRVGCTPDAFITDKAGRKGVLQAKSVDERTFQGWCADGETKAPLAYEVQTVVESMQTLRMDFAALGVLIVGYRTDLQILPVTVHEGAFSMFIKRTRAFWEDAEKGVAPPVAALDINLIKKLYPKPDGSIIDLSTDKELARMLSLHESYSAIISTNHSKIKEIEKKRATIRNYLKALMGPAEMALLPHGLQATLRLVEPKPSSYRKLNIREIKE